MSTNNTRDITSNISSSSNITTRNDNDAVVRNAAAAAVLCRDSHDAIAKFIRGEKKHWRAKGRERFPNCIVGPSLYHCIMLQHPSSSSRKIWLALAISIVYKTASALSSLQSGKNSSCKIGLTVLLLQSSTFFRSAIESLPQGSSSLRPITSLSSQIQPAQKINSSITHAASSAASPGLRGLGRREFGISPPVGRHGIVVEGPSDRGPAPAPASSRAARGRAS